MTTPIAPAFLQLMKRLAAALPLPRVRALHLPPFVDQPPGKDAEFCALELEDGSIGLSYVWLGSTFAALRENSAVRGIAGADPLAVARGYAQADHVTRTVGFAAINALSQHLFARAGYEPDATTDSVGLLAAQGSDHIGMVGLFPPLIERILATGARLTVAELKSELVQDNGRLRVTLDISELAACNKVISTSTILLNDTLDGVLGACSGASYFSVIGPGAGCLPDPLFARGVNTLGGTRIVDRDRFLDALAAGEAWRGSAQKYCIRRQDYPGVEVLMARAADRLRS